MTFLSLSVYLFGKITGDERVGILEKRLMKKNRGMCEKGLQRGTVCGKVSLSNVEKIWEWRKREKENVFINCLWKKCLLSKGYIMSTG